MQRPACTLALFLFTAIQVFCGEKAHIVVAADGSGNYRTIQDALNSMNVDSVEFASISY
jgi:hypothetical protein